MIIFLNGHQLEIASNRLQDLLESRGYTGKRIAIEINRQIVPKSEHASYTLKEGDTIEIVHAIGGG